MHCVQLSDVLAKVLACRQLCSILFHVHGRRKLGRKYTVEVVVMVVGESSSSARAFLSQFVRRVEYSYGAVSWVVEL